MLSLQMHYQRGLLDWLHATLAPDWRPSMRRYDGAGGALGDVADWRVINRLDLQLERAVRELDATYRAFQQQGWATGRKPDIGPLVRRLATAAARQFLSPSFPTPPVERAA